MQKRFILLLTANPLAWACGGTFPPPTQPMADAEAAELRAREVGADSQPEAKLEVKLASEQITQAKALIASGDNERASYLLLRARADAELALALSRERNALLEKQRALAQSSATLTSNFQ